MFGKYKPLFWNNIISQPRRHTHISIYNDLMVTIIEDKTVFRMYLSYILKKDICILSMLIVAAPFIP